MILDLFSHSHETTKENTAIYQQQKARLSLNAWVILFSMLEGQKLSAINFVSGIMFKQMQKEIIMLEYRSRFSELKKANIPMMFEILPTGVKVHWIPEFKLAELREKYLPFMGEVLEKLGR